MQPGDGYAPPVNDEEGEAEEADEDDGPDLPSTQHWYAVSFGRVVVFTLLGGWFYQAYWMYCCWTRYRWSEGYSRAPFWREVRQRTGYQVGPFWRALLGYGYCFSLFPAIAREARLAAVRGTQAPLLLALLYNGSFLFALAASRGGFLMQRALHAAIFGALQLTVNRLSDKALGSTRRERLASGELLCFAVGALLGLAQFRMLP